MAFTELSNDDSISGKTGKPLSELATAFNQRYWALGLLAQPLKWMSDDQPEDYDHKKIYTAASVIQSMRNALPRMIDPAYDRRFVRSNGSDWGGIDDLLSEAGYSEWITESRISKSELVKQMQDVVTLLRRYRFTALLRAQSFIQNPWKQGFSWYADAPDWEGRIQLAWDNALAGQLNGLSGIDCHMAASANFTGSQGAAARFVMDWGRVVKWQVSAPPLGSRVSGPVVDDYQLQIGSLNPDGAITAVDNFGHSFTSDGNGTNVPSFAAQHHLDFNFDIDVDEAFALTLSIGEEPPSTPPFGTAHIYGLPLGYYNANIYIIGYGNHLTTAIGLYNYDISSELIFG